MAKFRDFVDRQLPVTKVRRGSGLARCPRLLGIAPRLGAVGHRAGRSTRRSVSRLPPLAAVCLGFKQSCLGKRSHSIALPEILTDRICQPVGMPVCGPLGHATIVAGA
jgi:hypothetical protein